MWMVVLREFALVLEEERDGQGAVFACSCFCGGEGGRRGKGGGGCVG